MRAHPLATLISNDDDGFPFLSHLPLHLEQRNDALVLLGHCAKPNAHWRYLAQRPKAVVSFLGPHAYMSPRVYPDLARVPTWNYLAVHCTVQATLIEEPLAKDRLLKKLIADHDPAYIPQWIDLGADYQHKMLAGIVAFELTVTELQCKIKLNQHRPESHQKLRATYARRRRTNAHWASWMDRIGIGSLNPPRSGLRMPGGWHDDAACMALALAQAQSALAAGEVPVVAVVVKDGKVIATGP